MKQVTAMTQAERTRKHRDARDAEGWRLVQVYLEPRSATIVQTHMDKGLTTAQAINRCIVESQE